ncbi:hypothetical protein LTR96_010931 [Exophiala xenobiotica]|nr:hypothetical protein LTR92_010946 [Exophiala xenobiotica]KAK5263668.1 hypothetical protein LTR96_010931 [Exophiala xenobiotica]
MLALCTVMLLSQYPDKNIKLPKYSLPTGVPCTLVGAHLLGVRQVVAEGGNMKSLEGFMIQKRPTIAPLWLAAIWCGQAGHILNNAVLGYSSVNLPVSTWTGIPQSFIQYDYISSGPQGTIPRANEYRITYLVNAMAFQPKTPYPPFGYTKENNLSLEVSAHLYHDHYLQSYKMFWVVAEEEGVEGEDILAQSLRLSRRSASLQLGKDLPSGKPDLFRSEFLADGDYASENATRNIVNWHKDTEEGGIWIDMGNDHETRKLHMHPWIHRESSEYDSDASDASDAGAREVYDPAKVQKWLDDVSADLYEDEFAILC